MTKDQVLTYIAAILTTALETEPAPFPESMAYLAIGGNIDDWEILRDVLVGGSMVTVNNHAIQLTSKGREMAAKCNEALQSR